MGKVHQAPREKTMKPGTIQAMKWTWLHEAWGPTREGRKLGGPEQKILKLAQQGALSKPRTNWRQGPTCRWGKLPEDTRSVIDEGGHEMGQNGPRSVASDRSAHAISGPIRRPLWPRRPPGYLWPPCQEPRINPFVIRHRGVDKRGIPFGEERVELVV
jgi:hypothetical protein